MKTYFQLKYVKKTERLNEHYQYHSEWQNKIKEIQNRFSETIDTLRTVVPEYAKYTDDLISHEWSPFWIAVLETQATFDLPGVNSEVKYEIDHNTLEITLAEKKETL